LPSRHLLVVDLERKREERQQKKWLDPKRKAYMRAYIRAYNSRLREKILAELGVRCSKCGFDDCRALEIDHRNGGGTEERRRLSYPTYYLHVLRNLKNYQVLCANCNMIKRRERNEW
jgi:hypothetical protein